MYARIENDVVLEYPLSESDIKSRFWNVSFCVPFVPPDGYFNVAPVAKPPFNYTQNCNEGTPEKTDGDWVQVWVVSSASPAEIQQRLDDQWSVVRDQRNSLLASCDWTQLPDAPVTAEKRQEWVTYRQQLRDITSQSDPFNIVWPTEPT